MWGKSVIEVCQVVNSQKYYIIFLAFEIYIALVNFYYFLIALIILIKNKYLL